MQWISHHVRQLLVGALIVVIILLMAEFNNRMTELDRLTIQRGRSAAQITSLVQTQAVLQTQIAYATSVAAVEEWAYEEGKLVRPGDNPVVPLPGNGVASPTPVPPLPLEQNVVVQNWEIWYALFFDMEDAP